MALLRQELDTQTWKRRPQFEFFRDFHDPCYGICLRVDCTEAYKYAKSFKYSFFLATLYWTLRAAQGVEAFHLRLQDGRVFLYDRVDAGSVVDRPDGTFGFGHFLYNADMKSFISTAAAEVEQVRSTTELLRPEADNIIRCSSLPWIDFTSVTHAQKSPIADSCPRITFGKMTQNSGRRTMPVAVHVHHALVDGRDVGQFLEFFQEALSSPEQ